MAFCCTLANGTVSARSWVRFCLAVFRAQIGIRRSRCLTGLLVLSLPSCKLTFVTVLSHGCIHGHPKDIQCVLLAWLCAIWLTLLGCRSVWQILIGLGVQVRPNTASETRASVVADFCCDAQDGKLPYPYVPQGLLSVEQVDGF